MTDYANIRHVVIDIETLALSTNAVVLSIGMAVLSVTGNLIMSDLDFKLPAQPQIIDERVIDQDTISWWDRQSKEAREDSFIPMYAAPAVLGEGARKQLIAQLTEFYNVIRALGDGALVWGNGADFDIAILRSLLHDYKMPTPWSYKNVRCLRSVKNMLFRDGAQICANVKMQGIAHTATGDSLFEAHQLAAIIKACSDRGIIVA